MAVLPASELMLMTLPAPAARIPGSTAFTIRTAPKKFVSSCALASSTLVSSAAPVIEYPALLTSTSRRPALATTCSTQARTDSSERTSSATIVTPCDCALSGLRAVPKTLNPRSASSRAVAWPMPDEAPVTRIVCDMESPKGYAPHNAQWAIIVPSGKPVPSAHVKYESRRALARNELVPYPDTGMLILNGCPLAPRPPSRAQYGYARDR